MAAIREIGPIINQIYDIQGTIASTVEEQTATTNEIGRNVAEAARGSAEIAQNITGVAQAAQSTTGGAAETQRAATELARMASDLRALRASVVNSCRSHDETRKRANRRDSPQLKPAPFPTDTGNVDHIRG